MRLSGRWEEATGKPAWSVRTAAANFQTVRSAGWSRLYADDRGDRLYALGAGGRPGVPASIEREAALAEKSCSGLWRRRASVGLSGVAPGDSNKLIVTPGGADGHARRPRPDTGR